MKLFMLLFSLILLMFAHTSFGDDQREIKIRVPNSDYPPQYYRNHKNEWTGLDVELGRALVNAAGFEPRFVQLPWSRALDQLKHGDLHIMMNLSKTNERSKFLHWIGPERISQMVLVIKEGNKSIPVNTIDDLVKVAKKQNINFGIQQDIFYGDKFMEKLKSKAFAQYFERIANAEHNPRKVRVGRILGFFEDKITMRYRIRTDPDYKGLALHDFLINQEPVYFGISKKGISNSILKKLEQAFSIIKADGTLDGIRKKDWGIVQ